MNKFNNKVYQDENLIREWKDDPNLDWFKISEKLPKMNINFCREFRDRIKWLWTLYANDIELRPDIIKQFDLEYLMEGYKDPN